MARIKVDIPASFSFRTEIQIRITDINYGGHVGNDTVLSIMHEARMQFLQNYGYAELGIAGVGLIMSDVAIEFKKELFYGDQVTVSVAAGEFGKFAFELYYLLEKKHADSKVVAAVAKTGMVCYDYGKKKMTPVPDEVKRRLLA